MQNPFTTTFSKAPEYTYIATHKTDEILENFSYENPSESVYKITGVRGSGKTVILVKVEEELRSEWNKEKGWLVLDLNPTRDMLGQMAAMLHKEGFGKSDTKNRSVNVSATVLGTGGGIGYASEREKLVLEQNDVGKKGLPISNSLGLIIFKLIAAASLLAEILIMERKTGIAQRVAISKTGLPACLGGRGFVFFLSILLFTVVYFATAFIFRFDFGMRAPLRMAVLFVVMGVFTTAFGMLLASLLKDEGAVWNVGVLVLLPTSVLSGAMLPFQAMPEIMQKIGSIFPHRWMTLAVETLQDGGTLGDVTTPLMGILALSLLMFVVASVRYSRIISRKA